MKLEVMKDAYMLDGWMDGWMDGWHISVEKKLEHLFIHLYTYLTNCCKTTIFRLGI